MEISTTHFSYPVTQEMRRSLLRDSEGGWVMRGIKAFQHTAFSLEYFITYWSSSTSYFFIMKKIVWLILRYLQMFVK